MLAHSRWNMKTQPPPVNSPAVPHFSVAEARQLLELAITQDRPTSQDFSIPETSIKTGEVDFILPLQEIAPMLIELTR